MQILLEKREKYRKFYCTVSLTVLQWGFGLLHRQAARGAECIWRLGREKGQSHEMGGLPTP